jgi:very-short-patch-repair endonuclease
MSAAAPRAVEYDDDHHRLNRGQYVKDIRRAEMLDDLGWRVVRVIKEDRPRDIAERVSLALARRGSTPPPPGRSLGRGVA